MNRFHAYYNFFQKYAAFPFKWRYMNYPNLVVIPNLSLMEVSPKIVQYGKSKSNCQHVTELMNKYHDSSD